MTLKDNDDLLPGQICCLWEFQALISGVKKSVLLFSAIKMKPFRRKNNINLFDRIGYDLYGKQNIFRVITDYVDKIIAPCFVIPSTLKSGDYYEPIASYRTSVFFYYIPYEFFFRDDWGDTEVNIKKTKIVTILNSKPARMFSSIEESNLLTSKKRKRMTKKLIESIEANENEYEDVNDEEIILEGVLRAR